MISAFLLTLNEEEMLPYCLESFASIADQLDVLSVIDNGSSDATIDILLSFKDRIPMVWERDTRDSHHGRLRTKAIEKCHAPWIFYMDSDESFTNNMRDWLVSGQMEEADVWDWYKYSTIVDRFHTVEGGNGPSTRMFRNLPGVHFPQNVHTEPTVAGLNRKRCVQGVWMFDHTACKSPEALAAKGWRYQVHMGTIGIGPWHEYLGRVQSAVDNHTIIEIEPHVRKVISWGP